MAKKMASDIDISAEAFVITTKQAIRTQEENRKQKAMEKYEKLFGSALWNYPVHQFIGDIIQS